MKCTALVNDHKCATCVNVQDIFQEINDLNNHFKNQDDLCHTICSTLLHERYDSVNVTKSKNKKNKK